MAKNRKDTLKRSPVSPSTTDIPEEEQWRLIRESGVLSRVRTDQGARLATREDGDGPGALAEEIFDASVIIMPMAFFLVMMEILIHHQYAKQPSFGDIAQKLLNTFPIMFVFMFYTIRHKRSVRTQDCSVPNVPWCWTQDDLACQPRFLADQHRSVSAVCNHLALHRPSIEFASRSPQPHPDRGMDMVDGSKVTVINPTSVHG
ncbi:hypothetical protein BKA83DRAFT_1883273 [Pisolithus microcarpus]|nr:hypothetical protein BKA83DRAFT_1883273 [Pisolithus microcarpus]